MKVGLRADASQEIGAGHVMRQVALAQNLIKRGAEVFLAASISGPSWLRKYVAAQKGLVVVPVPEGNFDISIFGGLDLTGLAVDSYSIDTPGLRTLESIAQNTLCIVDGPWQNLDGKIGVSPVIDGAAPWLGQTAARFDEFFAGPEFFMLREEVLGLGTEPSMPHPENRISVVLSFGGGGAPDLVEKVLRVLVGCVSPLDIEVFSPKVDQQGMTRAINAHVVSWAANQEDFIRSASNAQLVISALGTTTAELCYLGVRAIFIPIVANQFENATAVENLGLAPVLWPDTSTFESDLAMLAGQVIEGPEAKFSRRESSRNFFGNGGSLVADILLR
jgi:spore coat polysaccharide biosynthesis predicted glycosyltransferase SpsG